MARLKAKLRLKLPHSKEDLQNINDERDKKKLMVINLTNFSTK